MNLRSIIYYDYDTGRIMTVSHRCLKLRSEVKVKWNFDGRAERDEKAKLSLISTSERAKVNQKLNLFSCEQRVIFFGE